MVGENDMVSIQSIIKFGITAICLTCNGAFGKEKESSLENLSDNRNFASWTEWADDYSKAMKVSHATGKPILIAFTGAGWCPWSMRMDEDIISKAAFSEALCDDMLFVRIDFPERDVLPIDKKTQYFGLKRRYAIQELPTLVLVDSSGDEILKLGYVPADAGEVAAHLKHAFEDYRQLKTVVNAPRLLEMRGKEIQELYKKADNLSTTPMRQQLLEAGLKSDQDAFFMMEQYENLLKTHAMHEPEVQYLRKKIIARDPVGLQGIQLKLATAEFHTLARTLKKKEDPEHALHPLLTYLQKFGNQDRDNRWRVEMMIAQFLFSKNKVAEATQHAKISYEQAPEEYRSEIAQSLDYLTKKLPTK
jgi:protein disulfide-isomerase